ncbi:MAG TPA: hypothetical protein VIC30_10355, partial [Orrella sp.]
PSQDEDKVYDDEDRFDFVGLINVRGSIDTAGDLLLAGKKVDFWGSEQTPIELRSDGGVINVIQGLERSWELNDDGVLVPTDAIVELDLENVTVSLGEDASLGQEFVVNSDGQAQVQRDEPPVSAAPEAPNLPEGPNLPDTESPVVQVPGDETPVVQVPDTNTGIGVVDSPVSSSVNVASAGASIVASDNALRSEPNDFRSMGVRAANGMISLDQVREAVAIRNDKLMTITAEVEIGSMTVSGDSTASGQIDCELPENVDLLECRPEGDQ